MNYQVHPSLIALSYVLQFLGFLGICYAWSRALIELRRGNIFYKTRLLLFVITSITLSAYIAPMAITACFFIEGCFQPIYRDYMRIFSGVILFLYGLFKFLLYYTKETPLQRRGRLTK